MRLTPLRPLRLLRVLALLCSLQAAAEVRAQAAVWVVPIEGEITPATRQFVADALERARDAQPLAVVFEIDTPGGRVTSAEEISQDILNADLPTIAVASEALSAGALVAMSAEELAMLPGGTIGAATAINGITGEEAPEKINSAWRGMFRSVAEARGRNARVAEAMVSKRIAIPGLSSSEELLTLSSKQAVAHKIANLEATSIPDALAQLGYGDVRLEPQSMGAWQRFVGALANPLIAALFLAVGVLGITTEVLLPGFGLPGILGIAALLLFFAGVFSGSAPSGMDVALLLGGLLLLALELLVIPGFGFAGAIGAGLLLWAIARLFQDDALTMLGYSTLIGVAAFLLLLKFLPDSRFARPLILSTQIGHSEEDALPQQRTSLKRLEGQTGTALSDLRPAGIAQIDGERVDVVTSGDYVARGKAIVVLRVEGQRVVVHEMQRTNAPQEA